MIQDSFCDLYKNEKSLSKDGVGFSRQQQQPKIPIIDTKDANLSCPCHVAHPDTCHACHLSHVNSYFGSHSISNPAVVWIEKLRLQPTWRKMNSISIVTWMQLFKFSWGSLVFPLNLDDCHSIVMDMVELHCGVYGTFQDRVSICISIGMKPIPLSHPRNNHNISIFTLNCYIL